MFSSQQVVFVCLQVVYRSILWAFLSQNEAYRGIMSAVRHNLTVNVWAGEPKLCVNMLGDFSALISSFHKREKKDHYRFKKWYNPIFPVTRDTKALKVFVSWHSAEHAWIFVFLATIEIKNSLISLCFVTLCMSVSCSSHSTHKYVSYLDCSAYAIYFFAVLC